jgi:hypothetical protein
MIVPLAPGAKTLASRDSSARDCGSGQVVGAKMTHMVLARAWRRRLYASLGMTLVVPMALLGALAVLALSGGIPGLGSLGEAFSGPSAPLAAPALGGQATGSRAGLLLRTRSGALSSAAGSSAFSASGALAGARGGSQGSLGPGGAPGAGRTGGGGGGSSGVGGYSGPSPAPGRKPSRNPTAVDRVLGMVTPLTSSLPAPIGPAVTRTLKSGGSVADRVLHQLHGL